MRQTLKALAHIAARKRSRSRLVAGLLACILPLVQTAASAQSFPDGRLIKLVSGASPGSASDIIGRVIGVKLQAELGVTVVVENRTGASGAIAAQAILEAPADGHTIFVQTGAHTITPFVAKINYDPLRDFSGVTPLAIVPNVLVVAPSAGYKTVHDLVAAGKAQPGRLNFGSAGAGSATYMSAEKFQRAAGISALHVPFKGSMDAITETVAGRIDYFFAPLVSALPLIKSGRLQPLAVNTSKRAALLPDVPTLTEAGVANADYLFWVGLLVSSKTPRDIVHRLNQVALKALQAPDVRARLAELGAEPMSMSPEQFDAMLRDGSASDAEILKAAGIKPGS